MKRHCMFVWGNVYSHTTDPSNTRSFPDLTWQTEFRYSTQNVCSCTSSLTRSDFHQIRIRRKAIRSGKEQKRVSSAPWAQVGWVCTNERNMRESHLSAEGFAEIGAIVVDVLQTPRDAEPTHCLKNVCQVSDCSLSEFFDVLAGRHGFSKGSGSSCVSTLSEELDFYFLPFKSILIP